MVVELALNRLGNRFVENAAGFRQRRHCGVVIEMLACRDQLSGFIKFFRHSSNTPTRCAASLRRYHVYHAARRFASFQPPRSEKWGDSLELVNMRSVWARVPRRRLFRRNEAMMKTNPNQCAGFEQALFSVCCVFAVALYTTVGPLLRQAGLPEWLTGMAVGAAPLGVLFFGGRELFMRWIWHWLPGNTPRSIKGLFETLSERPNGRVYEFVSSGTANITQWGLMCSLWAQTSMCHAVESLSMSFIDSTSGVLQFSGRLRHTTAGPGAHISGSGEFFLIYPNGDCSARPIGIVFFCQEWQAASSEPESIRVIYARPGMMDEVRKQTATLPIRLAA